MLHSTGGYLVGAYATTKYVFDVHPEKDVYWCTADCGWITGHTYVTYGEEAKGDGPSNVSWECGFRSWARWRHLLLLLLAGGLWCTEGRQGDRGHTLASSFTLCCTPACRGPPPGPLLLGGSQVLFEGVPTWPDAGRCWAICEKLKVRPQPRTACRCSMPWLPGQDSDAFLLIVPAVSLLLLLCSKNLNSKKTNSCAYS